MIFLIVLIFDSFASLLYRIRLSIGLGCAWSFEQADLKGSSIGPQVNLWLFNFSSQMWAIKARLESQLFLSIFFVTNSFSFICSYIVTLKAWTETYKCPINCFDFFIYYYVSFIGKFIFDLSIDLDPLRRTNLVIRSAANVYASWAWI